MKNLTVLLLSVLVWASLPCVALAQDINLTGYTLTFDDEFNSLSVTTANPKGSNNWFAGPANGPTGYFSASNWNVGAFSVSGGILSDQASYANPAINGQNWQSGILSSVDPSITGFTQQYGYFEIRCQMPNAGQGAWPSFWLDTTSGISGGQNEELDVFEWYGVTNTPGSYQDYVQQASHNWNADGSTNTTLPYVYSPTTSIPNGSYPWNGYHTYGCQVDPAHVTWYIDGVQTNQIATPTTYLTSPFYLILDYALGGGWSLTGTPFSTDGSSSLLVDWVRVYSLPSGSGPAAPTGLTAAPGSMQSVLSWTASSGATSYNVYRGTSAGGELTSPVMMGVTSTTFTDLNLTNGTTYYYKVTAVNGSGTSAYSNEASATPSAGTAAQVTWGAAQQMSGTTDVSTTGTLFDAATFYSTAETVNGVIFNPLISTGTVGGLPGYSDGKISANSPSGQPVATGTFATASPSSVAYSAATSTIGFGYFANGTVLISGLTASHSYQMQVWSYFPSSPGNANTTLTGANTVTLIPDTGEFAVGTFTAGSTSETFNFNYGNWYGAISAIAVRDITAGGGVPAAPTGLSATPGNTTAGLSWTAVSGSTSYNVYRGTSAGGESSTAIATGITSTTYTNTGLTNGTPYYYKVAAVNASGTSGYSNEASATPAASGSAPAAPTGLAATAGNASASLGWTASTGATSYNIYRGTTSGGESSTAIMTGVTSTTYTDSGLTNGTPYYYKITAVNSTGASGYSNEATATPSASGSFLIANGTYKVVAQSSGLALASNDITNGSAVVQQTYTGASTQQWTLNNLGNNVVSLIVSGSSAALEAPGSTTTNGAMLDVSAYTSGTNQQWTIVSVGSGYYEVINVNSGFEVNVAYGSTSPGGQICQYSSGNYSNGVWSFTGLGTPPAAPTGLNATAGNASTSLSWTASSGATSYNIYRGTSSGGESSTAIQTGITSTTYSDTGLTNGSPYYYKVTAVNASGTSGYSNEASATPTGTSNLLANGTYEITSQSDALALAASGTTNASTVVQQTYTGASTQLWSLNNLGSNVVSLEASGTSEALEAPGSTTTLGAMLDVSAYTSGTNQQWTISSVGGGYYEIVNVNSGQEVNVAYGSTSPGGQICQYTSGNYPNGVWTFTVPSVGGAPSTPTGLTGTPGSGSVSLSWTASSGAASYNIYRGTSAGGESTTAIATGVTSTTYTNSGLTNGTPYYYKVAAVNSSGTSGYSNEVSVTPAAAGGSAPAAPTGLTATAGNLQNSLSWTASSGATTYNIYRGTSAGGEGSTAITTGVTTTSYTNTGLTNGTPYYYKVAAVNSSGTSGYSNEATATPASGGATLVLAVGLERLVTGYNGPAIRIERPSDNTQTDIGFASGSNALDSSAVSTFLGTSTGWITTLYAQDGSGHNVTAPTSTDNMPTISVSAPTAITIGGVSYLTARNVTLAYGPNGEGNNRYFILPTSVSVDKSQTSVFLAFRPDFSGGPYNSMFEVGNPSTDAVDLMTGNTGLQGLNHNGAVAFSNTNLMPRAQPTVVGMVTAPGSSPLVYLDGVAHSTGGTAPASAICSGGYLMAGTGTGLYYGMSLYGRSNFLGFELYTGSVSSTTAASISNAMLPRGTIPSINLVIEGDSITEGFYAVFGYDMIRYVEPSLNHPADITNIALEGAPSGSAVYHVTGPTPATSAVGLLYNSSYSKNIYYIAMGTNDIIGEGGTAAAAWTNVQESLEDAKAMGFKTIVATVQPSPNESAAITTQVNDFNALLRAAVGQSYLDAIVDYDADSRLGNPANFYPAYSVDGIHPNDAGYQVMGTIAAPVFNSLIGP